MSTKSLFFDESGFTGYNLLDSTQPIFAIASTDIDEEAAEKILTDSFPKYQGPEFKFSNIWNSNNKKNLIKFSSKIEKYSDNSFVWMIDKKFAVLTKAVDFLIEPLITNAGYNFYANGFCWKYANYIHFGLTEIAAPDHYDTLVRTYQTFSRDPSRERLKELQSQLNIMASSADEPVRIFFEQMAHGASLFDEFHNLEQFKSTNEFHVSCMVAIIAYWRQRYSEDFSVIHDASSIFFRNKDVWESITSSDVPDQSHPLGDGTTVQFPLRVTSTNPIDSAESIQVQFCDVLAGLTTRVFDKRMDAENKELLQNVINAGFGEMRYNGVRPSATFPDKFPPDKKVGPDPVDLMAKIISGHKN